MNEDCIKNARHRDSSVPGADEVFGFGFGAAVTGKGKRCMNCKHLVGADGELCPVKKQRIKDTLGKIKSDGDNFETILTGMMGMDAPCDKYEKNKDGKSNLLDNLKYLEQLSKFSRDFCPKMKHEPVPVFTPPMVPAVKIDSITINIGVTKTE